MKKLLLTAFTPFDGERINPALEAVKLVKDKIGNLEIVKLEVPTVFGKSIETVREAIEREKPDFVLSIGQAGGRAEITPERIAINLDDARIPDNEGNQPIDEPIFPDGENAYFSTLPVKAMVEAIRKEGLPSSLSNSAGTYVCNHLMYGVLYYLDKRPSMKAGFIHVPYIPEQVKDKKEMPDLPLSDIVRGLEAAIQAVEENELDLKKAFGSEF
ncbi:pyroglutamyl-peptidase I [Oribacterium sp. oral taxon 108]|uniref:pyroglutamyl-peptidase I n=1 Tax=Oribacterium sp. oral taxon 108 TaxID=712414 RepID=UPI00020DD6ED|nr:pyroglutamyl-peptidase I [Oribacterium sp. oral taxon 108]EGL36492.1 pyroglutamyl-peptidase I [Oribacterium sp. oral taxon 108 str. F0425]